MDNNKDYHWYDIQKNARKDKSQRRMVKGRFNEERGRDDRSGSSERSQGSGSDPTKKARTGWWNNPTMNRPTESWRSSRNNDSGNKSDSNFPINRTNTSDRSRKPVKRMRIDKNYGKDNVRYRSERTPDSSRDSKVRQENQPNPFLTTDAFDMLTDNLGVSIMGSVRRYVATFPDSLTDFKLIDQERIESGGPNADDTLDIMEPVDYDEFLQNYWSSDKDKRNLVASKVPLFRNRAILQALIIDNTFPRIYYARMYQRQAEYSENHNKDSMKKLLSWNNGDASILTNLRNSRNRIATKLMVAQSPKILNLQPTIERSQMEDNESESWNFELTMKSEFIGSAFSFLHSIDPAVSERINNSYGQRSHFTRFRQQLLHLHGII